MHVPIKDERLSKEDCPQNEKETKVTHLEGMAVEKSAAESNPTISEEATEKDSTSKEEKQKSATIRLLPLCEAHKIDCIQRHITVRDLMTIRKWFIRAPHARHRLPSGGCG